LSSEPERPPYAALQPPGENSAPAIEFGAKIENRPPPPMSSSSPRVWSKWTTRSKGNPSM
jgi:hypothetical protein